MDGVTEEWKAQRERNDGGEAGRRRAWSEGGGEGGQGKGRGEMKEGSRCMGEIMWRGRECRRKGGQGGDK